LPISAATSSIETEELKDFLVLSGSVIVTINFDLYEGPKNLLYPKYQGDKR